VRGDRYALKRSFKPLGGCSRALQQLSSSIGREVRCFDCTFVDIRGCFEQQDALEALSSWREIRIWKRRRNSLDESAQLGIELDESLSIEGRSF